MIALTAFGRRLQSWLYRYEMTLPELAERAREIGYTIDEVDRITEMYDRDANPY